MRLRKIGQRIYKGTQLFFHFGGLDLEGGTRSPSALVKVYAAPPPELTSPSERPIHLRRRDHALESQARELLHGLRADKLAREIRVEWNPRLKTCAGRADYREKLIALNPLLRELNNPPSGSRDETQNESESSISSQQAGHLECNMHSRSAGRRRPKSVVGKLECKMHSSLPSASADMNEVERTLRHELAHLLAQWRVGRRRIAPHGAEWRRACRDLGIADEARCHNLPFATKAYSARYVYICPNCKQKFLRARRIRRAIACLACCRKHNRGDFDPRFRLRMIKSQQKEAKETKVLV